MFGLAIHRIWLHLCGHNNLFAGFDIPYLEGEGRCATQWTRFPLSEGSFMLRRGPRRRRSDATITNRSTILSRCKMAKWPSARRHLYARALGSTTAVPNFGGPAMMPKSARCGGIAN
jgi:hypothetical protein